jgi:hypothetical protein
MVDRTGSTSVAVSKSWDRLGHLAAALHRRIAGDDALRGSRPGFPFPGAADFAARARDSDPSGVVDRASAGSDPDGNGLGFCAWRLKTPR